MKNCFFSFWTLCICGGYSDESTRVVLTSSPDNPAASYINANYIRVRTRMDVKKMKKKFKRKNKRF